MDLTTKEPNVARTLYLIGWPPLKDFIRFATQQAVACPDQGQLVDTWQAARKVVQRLEQEEAGVADNPPREQLGAEYRPLLVELLKDPLIRNGFNTVPTEVAMVELDRLVVYQEHVDITFADQLKERLGSSPPYDEIFRTCLPYGCPQPPVEWSRVRRDKFVYVSPSNDLRFLGPMPMQNTHIKDYPPPGNLVGVLGIAVGFGSNFLNAIYAENRLVLNNGSHRAYALRQMGITHVPCIVQHVSSRDELEVVGSSDLKRTPDFYFKHPRPPMLKDYFDSRVHTVMAVRRRLRQVTVKFEVEEDYVPLI